MAPIMALTSSSGLAIARHADHLMASAYAPISGGVLPRDAQAMTTMPEEKHGFQAEVGRLLDIVAHSLYSDRAVFLRELISNASDACDRLRYLSLTQAGLLGDDPDLEVVITIDKVNRRLTIADNGIGMNHDE